MLQPGSVFAGGHFQKPDGSLSPGIVLDLGLGVMEEESSVGRKAFNGATRIAERACLCQSGSRVAHADQYESPSAML